MDAFMGWGIQFFSISGVPSVFQLVFNLRKFLYAFPIAFGAAAMAAGHRRILTEPWVLVTASVALAAVHLVLCYGVMLAGVAISGGFTPRRMPGPFAVSEAKKSVRVSFRGMAGKHVDGSTCPACGAYVDWDGGMYVCQCGLTNHSADLVLNGDTAAIRNIELANVTAEQFGIPWHDRVIIGTTVIPRDDPSMAFMT